MALLSVFVILSAVFLIFSAWTYFKCFIDITKQSMIKQNRIKSDWQNLEWIYDKQSTCMVNSLTEMSRDVLRIRWQMASTEKNQFSFIWLNWFKFLTKKSNHFMWNTVTQGNKYDQFARVPFMKILITKSIIENGLNAGVISQVEMVWTRVHSDEMHEQVHTIFYLLYT